MLVILLAPLLLLTVMFILLSFVIPMPYLILTNIALNALGSSVDLYVSFLLIAKYRSDMKINFHPEKVILNVYEQIKLHSAKDETA